MNKFFYFVNGLHIFSNMQRDRFPNSFPPGPFCHKAHNERMIWLVLAAFYRVFVCLCSLAHHIVNNALPLGSMPLFEMLKYIGYPAALVTTALNKLQRTVIYSRSDAAEQNQFQMAGKIVSVLGTSASIHVHVVVLLCVCEQTKRRGWLNPSSPL